jgi:hypothetical protein
MTYDPNTLTTPGSTATSEPTLDAERLARLRTFLVVQAAADAVQPVGISAAGLLGTGSRRFIAGTAVALLLGGGLFTANALAGGPGPTRIDQAVAITEDDGWTTIRVVDLDADPDAVVAQLEAAGIPAIRARYRLYANSLPVGSYTVVYDLTLDSDPNQLDPSLVDPGKIEPTPSPDAMVASPRGGIALAIAHGPAALPEGERPRPLPRPGDGSGLDPETVRINADGSVSIRDGSDNTVMVYDKPA